MADLDQILISPSNCIMAGPMRAHLSCGQWLQFSIGRLKVLQLKDF